MKAAKSPHPPPRTLARVGRMRSMDEAKRIPENRFIQLPNCFESRRPSLGSFDFIANESKSFAIQPDPY